MKWDRALRWDGETNKKDVAAALVGWLNDEDRQTADKISYGDLGVLLRKNYRNRGSGRDCFTLWGYSEGCEVQIGRWKCQLTWNKAAKLIKETIMAKGA